LVAICVDVIFSRITLYRIFCGTVPRNVGGKWHLNTPRKSRQKSLERSPKGDSRCSFLRFTIPARPIHTV
jgi:hypothetical protein